jgi:hypothetical protein
MFEGVGVGGCEWAGTGMGYCFLRGGEEILRGKRAAVWLRLEWWMWWMRWWGVGGE